MADPAVTGGGEGEQPEYEDILGDCTILVKRVVINKNPGAKVGERVTIRWTREIPELEKSFPTEDVTFTLGDGDVEQAVELITSLMKLGEKFTCIAGYKYMYGEFGQEPDVPAKANFKFDIELLSNDGIVDYPNMDFDTRFNEAKKKKERGNILFRRRDFPQALNLYMTACKIVDRDLGFDYPDEAPEKLQEVQEFRAVILCNTSVAQLKSQLYDAAVLSAREATKICPSYSKAFFRLGQAYERTGQVAETLKSYKKALDLNSDDSKVKLSNSELNFIQSEVEKLKEKQQKSQASEKQMYSRMFGGDSAVPDTKDKSSDKTQAKTLAKSRDNNSNSVHQGENPGKSKNQDGQRPNRLSSNKSLPKGQGTANPPQSSMESIDKNMFAAGMKAAQQVLAESSNGQNAMASALHRPENKRVNQVPAAMLDASRKAGAQFPDLESSLAKLKDKVDAGMTQEEALSMASDTLNEMGLGAMGESPDCLMEMSEQIAAMIPDDVRAHFEQSLKKHAEEALDTDDANNDDMNERDEATKPVDINNDDANERDSEETKPVDMNMKPESAILGGAVGGTKGNPSLPDTDGTCGGHSASTATKPQAASNQLSPKKAKDTKGMVSLWEKKIQEHMFPSNLRAAREEVVRKKEEKNASRRKASLEQASTSETLSHNKAEHHSSSIKTRLRSNQDANENEECVSELDKLKSQKTATKTKKKLKQVKVKKNEKGQDSKHVPDFDTTARITDENDLEPEIIGNVSKEDVDLDSFIQTIVINCVEEEVRRQVVVSKATELDKGSETTVIKESSVDFEDEYVKHGYGNEDTLLETAAYAVLAVAVVSLAGYGIYRYTRK